MPCISCFPDTPRTPILTTNELEENREEEPLESMGILKAYTVFSFNDAVRSIRNGELQIHDATAKLLQQLTIEERLSLLDGDIPFWEGMADMFYDRYNRDPYIHGAVPRLGIPGIRFTDGPRGVVVGESTAFPVAMGRGATWDLELEEKVGNVIGLEGRAQGANFFGGVCVNLPRHPAWGRIQETYGEDPLLLGEFGAALTRGVQRHLMACVKHYALNSMENMRFAVDVSINEATLHEIYLPHFRRIVEEGVASVMSAYNSVNGEWAGQNKTLLTNILREQWKFDGFVISDFVFGLRDAARSLRNGLDLEAPFIQQRGMHLRGALERGDVETAHVNRSCERLLRKQLEFAARLVGTAPDKDIVFCREHRDLTRNVAAQAMVLLQNNKIQGQGSLLPLDAGKIKRCAVIGRLANRPNTGDRGSSTVHSPEVITPYHGIKQALPNADVILDESDSAEQAEQLASNVDTVVVIVGYDAGDEGEYVVPSLQQRPELAPMFPLPETQTAAELLSILKGDRTASGNAGFSVGDGGDRQSLRLRKKDVDIICAVAAANPRTVVSIVAGGAVIMEEWRYKVPAVLMGWYSGCEGGHALADVLLGRADAVGRLPFSIPRDESYLPPFDRNAEKVTYSRWHGQWLLDKLGEGEAFPLGYGLSYTQFTFSDLTLQRSDKAESLNVSVTVSNTGTRRGRCVAQAYGLPGVPTLPRRLLLGFKPVWIEAGLSERIRFDVSIRPVQHWSAGRFSLATHRLWVEVGAYSGDSDSVSTVVHFSKSSL
ncbi:hypothetical protein FQN50_002840 [Emmonsiellopsis sp. PD_5]|nr:hypothetical protein FQN50_002840 [Emmonsiellopsis sp. PD_5]